MNVFLRCEGITSFIYSNSGNGFPWPQEISITDLGRPLFIPKPGFECYNVAEGLTFKLSLADLGEIQRRGKDDDGDPSIIARVH